MDRQPALPSRWQRALLLFKIAEVRLRFVAILIATGLVIGYWESIRNRWHRFTRRAQAGVAAPARDTEFYCPMHPGVVRPEADPGGAVPKCPICGMALSVRPRGASSSLPPGVTGRVQLSPDRIRLAGVATEEVTARPLVQDITTLGTVRYDEARVFTIVTRSAGFLEKMHVARTFDPVTAGQPLVDIYSPELSTAADELVLATAPGASGNLAAAARAKLALLGVDEREIAEVQRSRQFTRRLTIRSPVTGHVIRKAAQQGMRVEVGATLFEVADLSVVWIEADAYEKDVPLLRTGQAAEATLESLPGRTFPGTVQLVHPHVDESTRTIAVRVALPNPGHALKPGMAATVRMRVPLADLEPYRSRRIAARAAPRWWCPMHPEVTSGKAGAVCAKCGGMPLAPRPAEPSGDALLAVPEPAVIDTGLRKIVYVEREPGVFDGRAVELGPRAGAFYPVLSGLAPGERVVVRAAFLVDAETRLNPAAAGTYVGAGDTRGGRP
jgi:Cu(I)/Ag(I) efflux system membrane fusion protein